MNPAPTDMNISLIFKVYPVGAPFTAGSPDKDNEVFAMHIGNLSNP